MSNRPSRTRMTAVYLTASERDLVRSALELLSGELSGVTVDSARRWAASYTKRRIDEAIELFAEPEASASQEDET